MQSGLLFNVNNGMLIRELLLLDHIEEDRIGTALWKNSVPEKYKQYPIIGQGATSVVLDKGDGNVIVLTRDAMKKDWLCQNWGLGLGDWIETLDIGHRKSRELSELQVYVIVMPKLFALSPKNKKNVKQSITQYEEIVRRNSGRITDRLMDYLEKHPDGLFAQLIEFLLNYDESQYSIDFLMRNFLQDAQGNIVLIDPIVSRDLVDILRAVREYRH
jgi:hypothetical protein